MLVAAPFAGAAALALVGAAMGASSPEARRRHASWIAATTVLLAMLAFGVTAPGVFEGEVARMRVEWLPALGVGFGLRMDGLALLFCALILGIGLLVVLYARWYLDPAEPTPRFFALLLTFMGAMLGIALADSLLLLVMFWEVTSLASFLLIGFWQQRADARQGARMALTVTGLGGLALLAGVLLLGWMAGGLDLDTVLAAGDQVRAHPAYPLCLALILLGAFSKSAQFPLHFWLPHAMAAPTPVSAYLHSATLVKAGIFLLARLYPVLSGTEPWFWAVTLTGAATLLVGAWHAIFQHDLKGLLAYSTISHLGLITLLLGLNSPLAAVAAVFHLLNHATFKAALFMAAGIIDHETGTRDMRRINGLARRMPITAALAIVSSAAMAGVPLLNGFLSKEMFLAETLAVEGHAVLSVGIPLVAVLACALSVAYSARLVHDVFFHGEPVDLPREPHEPPRWMRVPVELLTVLCLAVGLLPAYTVAPLLEVGARDLLGGALPAYSLAIWHGWNLPFTLSVVALAAGVAIYAWLARSRRLHEREPGASFGRAAFDALLDTLLRGARSLDASLQQETARRSLWLTVAVMALALMLPLWARGLGLLEGVDFDPWADLNAGAVLIAAMLCAAALGAARFANTRMVALVMVGAVGLLVSLAFIWFSAPDLALTQLLVEVASTLLMVLALRYLPLNAPTEPARGRRWRDGVLATMVGLGVGLCAWAVMVRPPIETLAREFMARALPEGGGSNVVNVIIVDFRGFDTFGEMTVLIVAALVIHALLAQVSLPQVSGHCRVAHPAPSAAGDLLLGTVARTLLPFTLLIAVYFFLRGHMLPGGGFIAGLMAALALLLQTTAGQNTQRLDDGIGHWHALLGAGLLTACLTGLGAWMFGYPFLTSSHGHPVLPAVGEVPLASAALFDLGVFMAVVGATVLALTDIGRLARRRR